MIKEQFLEYVCPALPRSVTDPVHWLEEHKQQGGKIVDFRKVFDSIPEGFDKWRPRYCDELFSDVIEYSKLNASKTALEIGPGTGQATEPFLKTGCSYLAIELGEHLAEYTKKRFHSYDNFHIVNADFETYDFGQQKFDLVFSAATIQWIPEKIGFPKVHDILKSGGTLAMFMTRSDYKAPNEALYYEIQQVYKKYFHPETEYTCKLEYNNVVNYGFINFEYRDYRKVREFTADEYVSYISTHADHITLQEPNKSDFYEGIKEAILNADNKIVLNDTIALYLAKKL
jgi:SAM-dependent methyltransferase